MSARVTATDNANERPAVLTLIQCFQSPDQYSRSIRRGYRSDDDCIPMAAVVLNGQPEEGGRSTGSYGALVDAVG
jgi:hypothetical protein